MHILITSYISAGDTEERTHCEHNGEQGYAGEALPQDHYRLPVALPLHLYSILFLWTNLSSLFLLAVGKLLDIRIYDMCDLTRLSSAL